MPQLDMRRRYRSMNDVRQRHNGTIVGVVNSSGSVVPYRVEECTGELRDCRLVLRGHSDSRDINIQDPALVLDRPDCGFANLQMNGSITGAVYFSTTSSRQYKRSLNFQNLHINPVGDYASRYYEGSRGNMFKACEQFFNDNYPTFQKALEILVEGRGSSVAFSRKFALCLYQDKGIVVWYKNTVVGYVNDEDEAVLVPAYQHLQEQLEESV